MLLRYRCQVSRASPGWLKDRTLLGSEASWRAKDNPGLGTGVVAIW